MTPAMTQPCWDCPSRLRTIAMGRDSNGYQGYCLYTLDVMDPNWTAANIAELGVQINDFPGRIQHHSMDPSHFTG